MLVMLVVEILLEFLSTQRMAKLNQTNCDFLHSIDVSQNPLDFMTNFFDKVTRKTTIDQSNEKRSSLGIKSTVLIWKMNCCSKLLQL